MLELVPSCRGVRLMPSTSNSTIGIDVALLSSQVMLSHIGAPLAYVAGAVVELL